MTEYLISLVFSGLFLCLFALNAGPKSIESVQSVVPVLRFVGLPSDLNKIKDIVDTEKTAADREDVGKEKTTVL